VSRLQAVNDRFQILGATGRAKSGMTHFHPIRSSAGLPWRSVVGQGPTKSPIVCLAPV